MKYMGVFDASALSYLRRRHRSCYLPLELTNQACPAVVYGRDAEVRVERLHPLDPVEERWIPSTPTLLIMF